MRVALLLIENGTATREWGIGPAAGAKKSGAHAGVCPGMRRPVFSNYSAGWMLTFCSRRELVTTLIELNAIAISASTGCMTPTIASGTMMML